MDWMLTKLILTVSHDKMTMPRPNGKEQGIHVAKCHKFPENWPETALGPTRSFKGDRAVSNALFLRNFNFANPVHIDLQLVKDLKARWEEATHPDEFPAFSEFSTWDARSKKSKTGLYAEVRECYELKVRAGAYKLSTYSFSPLLNVHSVDWSSPHNAR